MKTIAIVQQKGGCAKSTTAITLALGFHKAGFRTLLVDTDSSQGTVMTAYSVGCDNDFASIWPTVISNPTAGFINTLEQMKGAYDICIVDTPGHLDKDSKAMTIAAAAIRTADLVVVPVQPSPNDIWAVQPVVDMIKQRQMLTGGTPVARFVLVNGKPSSKLAKMTLEAFQAMELPHLQGMLQTREQYKTQMAIGQSVIQLKRTHAAYLEAVALVQEVATVLGLDASELTAA